jgi:hypothetical protein
MAEEASGIVEGCFEEEGVKDERILFFQQALRGSISIRNFPETRHRVEASSEMPALSRIAKIDAGDKGGHQTSG